MSAKWSPSDDELDVVARSLPSPARSADRVEQDRTSLLAQAAGLSQAKRQSRAPMIAALSATLAVAAGLLIWIVSRPSEQSGAREVITALGPAQYERKQGWPDFIVQLDDGRVSIQVAKLAAGERFRAKTADAEVEVRGTRFIVGAEHGTLTSVAVSEGRVEIRWAQQPPIFLSAGETWTPVQTAQQDAVDLAPGTPAIDPATTAPAAEPPVAARVAAAPNKIAPPSTSQGASSKPLIATKSDTARSESKETGSSTTSKASVVTTTSKPAVTTTSKPSAVTSTTSTPPEVTRPPSKPAVAPAPSVATTPSPGEAEFRAGVASLRAGDPTAATRSFTSACAAAKNGALGEDACFWVGAAARRAAQTSTARDALTRFLKNYPSSARAGEASALLGWILYEAGELDAAKQRFDFAARDRVPKVKESAERGLEALRRKPAEP